MHGILSTNHVHMFVEMPPHIAVSRFVQRVKGRSSRKVQQEFPALRKRYWGQRFWARGYFCTTSGNITEIILQYLQVVEVVQSAVDTEARWVKKGGKSVFGYKQHTLVDDDGLVIAVETTAANQHDSKPMLDLLDKAAIKPGARVHADKAYCSQKHREALKARGIKNAFQDKAVKNKLLTRRQLQRNRLITKSRYVVERTFGGQARWFGSKMLRYQGLDKAHTWHILQAMAYNLKRLPKLFIQSLERQETCVF